MVNLILDFIKTIQYSYSARHFTNWDGRSGRREYVYFVLFLVIAHVAENIMFSSGAQGGLFVLELIVSISLTVPFFALCGRRLHDLNLSAWWVIIFLAPLLNIMLVFLLMTAPSYQGQDNRFEEE